MNKRILLVLMIGVGLMTGPAFAQSDFGEYGTILPVKGAVVAGISQNRCVAPCRGYGRSLCRDERRY